MYLTHLPAVHEAIIFIRVIMARRFLQYMNVINNLNSCTEAK
jgi:hypothetical protein